MSDSEDEHEQEEGIGLAGFLFGNISATGQLENDVFDEDTQRYLSALRKLGLGGQVDEVISENERANGPLKPTKPSRYSYDDSDSDEDEEEECPNKEIGAQGTDKTADDANDIPESSEDLYGNEKSPSAVDYFDIAELADEDFPSSSKILPTDTDNTDYDEDDASLMPPPPVPPLKVESTNSKSPATEANVDGSSEKKLETPLAAMLPSKYVGINVCDVFPDFRPDKILRFARLFGTGKPGSIPQWWKSVKKRRKKKKAPEGANTVEDPLDGEREKYGFDWHFADDPLDSKELSAEEQEFLNQIELSNDQETPGDKSEKKQLINQYPKTWRNGPAAVWYDMLGVPPDEENLDYGFKLKPAVVTRIEEVASDEEDNCDIRHEEKEEQEFPDDVFHMVTQVNWESNIIWDGTDSKFKKLNKISAGWVPNGMNRTAQTFNQPGKGIPSSAQPSGMSVKTAFGPGASGATLGSSTAKSSKLPLSKHDENSNAGGQGADDTWYSIFPVETGELVHGRWEDEVIWDTENMEYLPKPKVLSIDPNDDNVVLCIPDDIDPNAVQGTTAPVKVKIPHPHVKKSKILLGKAGVINVIEEDSPPPSPKNDDKDPYNISNDEYYQPKFTEQSLLKISSSGNIIQHSTPVVELRTPYIPTHMGELKLRNFHRPPLKRYSHGTCSMFGPHQVLPLTRHIKKKEKQREQERLAAGGGDIFFMRTPEDLTGADGALLLFEYCEEHPPLLNQVGMCSKIKNYYKRKAGKDTGPPELTFGELTYAHTSPFLGAMHPGETIQTIENNLYRAPIYDHPISKSDFVVIRTRSNIYIREFDALFTVGQECPLYEVPGPNSKRANNFVRDFLQVFIYRLFWKSRDNPRRIKMDDIKKAFPLHSESSIRKRLKLCADFKRTGADSNWWVIKPEFRLPTEEEIRAMVSPEQCCAYFSLIAAEQRLKDAGYGEKFLFAPQDDDDEENQGKMDDEVKVAPWNTTRAYIQAMKGKCLLQLVGPADPTGCGEGFSYIRVPNKPQTSKEEQQKEEKRIVTGTDADLRRLSLNNAKALLKKFEVPEEEIKKLSRWEIIDVVRTLSTEKAKAGEKGMTKFSRGNRFSVAEHQERYKEECQRIFELQNKVLASHEILSSTDESESSEDELSDIEEMGKNIENMLSNKKTSSQLNFEKEEQERRELQQMILGEKKSEDEKQQKKPKKKEEEENSNMSGLPSHPGRIVKIHRTYKNAEGKEFTRTEIVRKPALVDIYSRMRSTKDEDFIRQFAMADDQAKEEMKKEKRRIQEQLRRIKRNQEKEANRKEPQRKKKVKVKPDLKMKCGACGQVGHMKTNKACPKYQHVNSPVPPLSVALTEEQEEEIEKEIMSNDSGLMKVEGIKLQISKKLVEHHEKVMQRSLLLKVPKDAVGVGKKRKRYDSGSHLDYLKRGKTTNRRRVDPVVVMQNIFEAIHAELKSLPDINPFMHPVNQGRSTVLPSYFEKIKFPMDLQTIKSKINDRKYQLMSEFLSDVKLIADNSSLYNGEDSALTQAARRMYDLCKRRITEKEDKLLKLEKQINPLLDDNDQKSLNYILEVQVLNKLKSMKEAAPFLKPVNKKQVPDYYERIDTAIDLETMSKKINNDQYHSRRDFMADMVLLQRNAETYNGTQSSFNAQAKTLLATCEKLLKEYDEKLSQIEENIDTSAQKSGEDDMDSDEEYENTVGADDDGLDDAEPSVGKSSLFADDREEGEYVSEGEETKLPILKKRKITDGALDDDSQQAVEAMMKLSESFSSRKPLDGIGASPDSCDASEQRLRDDLQMSDSGGGSDGESDTGIYF